MPNRQPEPQTVIMSMIGKEWRGYCEIWIGGCEGCDAGGVCGGGGVRWWDIEGMVGYRGDGGGFLRMGWNRTADVVRGVHCWDIGDGGTMSGED